MVSKTCHDSKRSMTARQAIFEANPTNLDKIGVWKELSEDGRLS